MFSLRFFLASITILMINATVFAETEELEERTEFLRNVLTTFQGGTSELTPPHFDGCEECTYKCGTPFILESIAMQLNSGESLVLGTLLSQESDTMRFLDTILTQTFDSPAGYFKIHYTTGSKFGQHRIDLSYGDQNANGIPDYPEIVARIADSVWVHHINGLGFHEPLNDGDYPWGGDSRYDIYVMNVGSLIYGATYPDVLDPLGNGRQMTSFMTVHTHYEGFPGYEDKPLDALRVTIAHEFGHSIQFWYDAWESFQFVSGTMLLDFKAYWLEMSAVWLEESMYDHINDYYYYLKPYITHVHRSLKTFSDGSDWQAIYPYGAVLFPIYLSETLGEDIVRRLWERCAENKYADFLFGGIQDVLTEKTAGTRTFNDVFAEYSQWLYFTGSRRPSFFSEGVNYAKVPELDTIGGGMIQSYIRTYSDYPIEPLSETRLDPVSGREYAFFPYDLGINYIDFRLASLDSLFTLYFDGVTISPEPVDWRISVMAYNRDLPDRGVWVADSVYRNRDIIQVRDFDNYTDLIIVPATTNPYLDRPTTDDGKLNYRFTVSESSIKIPYTKFNPPYPSKFMLEDAKERPLIVKVDLSEDASVTMKIFTVAGEEVFSTSRNGFKNEPVRLLWQGENVDHKTVASGVYIVHVRAGEESENFKVLVIR